MVTHCGASDALTWKRRRKMCLADILMQQYKYETPAIGNAFLQSLLFYSHHSVHVNRRDDNG